MLRNANKMSHHLAGMLKFDEVDGWEFMNIALRKNTLWGLKIIGKSPCLMGKVTMDGHFQ